LALHYDRLGNAITARRKNNMTTCCRDYILFGRFSTIIFDDYARTVATGMMMIIRFFPVRNRHPFLPGKITLIVGLRVLCVSILPLYRYIVYTLYISLKIIWDSDFRRFVSRTHTIRFQMACSKNAYIGI